jgi:hypothetical protein
VAAFGTETFSYIFTDNGKIAIALIEPRSREKHSGTDGVLFNPSEGDSKCKFPRY